MLRSVDWWLVTDISDNISVPSSSLIIYIKPNIPPRKANINLKTPEISYLYENGSSCDQAMIRLYVRIKKIAFKPVIRRSQLE